MSDGKCATCGKVASDEFYTCSHNMLGHGFIMKGINDTEAKSYLEDSERVAEGLREFLSETASNFQFSLIIKALETVAQNYKDRMRGVEL